MSTYTIRALTPDDRAWVDAWMREHWGGEVLAVRGELYRPADHPGLVAEEEGTAVGLLTYIVQGAACEILSLDSLREGRGIGAALIDAVAEAARGAGCMWLQLVTTNDNLQALGFYQRRGFRLVGIDAGAVDRARATYKPGIPKVATNGIPIRDELELVREL